MVNLEPSTFISSDVKFERSFFLIFFFLIHLVLCLVVSDYLGCFNCVLSIMFSLLLCSIFH